MGYKLEIIFKEYKLYTSFSSVDLWHLTHFHAKTLYSSWFVRSQIWISDQFKLQWKLWYNVFTILCVKIVKIANLEKLIQVTNGEN